MVFSFIFDKIQKFRDRRRMKSMNKLIEELYAPIDHNANYKLEKRIAHLYTIHKRLNAREVTLKELRKDILKTQEAALVNE
ncbi:hypothetical protein L596_017690 [Steinernema carpocapsae]|uniref:Uncharacterized protein n=1 Tax=Steinernema carpocapsae TaxID=34508 RepID=A0A4U5N2N3_STECR|nr:hypothetical protein L596_017690 [Steinernema carpocapsae]